MLKYLLIGLAVLVFLGLLLGAAALLGPELRRRLTFSRGQKLLREGNWSDALSLFQALQSRPRLSAAWQAKLRTAIGECHHHAATVALKDRRFEAGLEHFLQAAPLLDLSEADLRTQVVEQMLAELRRLFAAGPAETEAFLELLVRVFNVQTPCPEATFWQGLNLVRQANLDAAVATLNTAHEQAGKAVLDPALYLGILHHRLGKYPEALRYLADANRVDASCPFVTLNMGITLIASGGDSMMAMRALHRALGSRGLPLWLQTPERAWVEAFPESKSYVRRLAAKNPYVCPLMGGDLNLIIRQGNQALAQAYYRQGNYQEAADLFTKLMQDGAPTVPLMRGLGLSLARQGKYDLAYKHLRLALEQEDPKEPFTAGYLALCGAMGKPTKEEDRPRNVAWAIKLLARFQQLGNAEWAEIVSAVFAEARKLGMQLPAEDQLHLCNVLGSVQATDPRAAEAYAYLAASYPDSVLPIHSWLYSRAATVHNLRYPRDLVLFAQAFKNPEAAKGFYERHKWSFEDVEYTFLARSAAAAPGAFPPALGLDYPPRGEAFLLARSAEEEQKGNKEAALASVEVLLQLMPGSLKGHDRLACLHYRKGDVDRAVALLGNWQKLDPSNHWPLVRQAILEQQRGNAARREQAIQEALGLTQGPTRAAVAYLGARLALRESATGWQKQGLADPAIQESLHKSQDLLKECLRHDPEHVEALWCLAAVRSCVGDQQGLAEQAAVMNKPAVKDARFHYLGAVCSLAAKDYSVALELTQRSAQDPALAAESHYLMALAHLHLGDGTAAQKALEKVTASPKTPSLDHARAQLGQLSFSRSAYDDAIKWWNQIDAKRRPEWKLDDPLRGTVYLAGLLAYEQERYETAADRFREAGKLGLREKRLGSLLTLALIKAGQRLLFGDEKPAARPAPKPAMAPPQPPPSSSGVVPSLSLE